MATARKPKYFIHQTSYIILQTSAFSPLTSYIFPLTSDISLQPSYILHHTSDILNVPASELVAFFYPVEFWGTHPVVVVGYFVGRRATCLKQACPMLQLDYSH